MRRAPADWVPPGPTPPAIGAPLPDEDLSYLCGDWRIFQKHHGHRWSLDDLVTAWVACREAPHARTALDLGCGLGSVLLMCAWKLPDCTLTGIEAQPDRAAMARRSIAYDGANATVHDGDFRAGFEGRFDLITGTPPYFERGAGTLSEKTHAAACRFEFRGGVEAYVGAALPHLNDGGVLVLCGTRPAIPSPSLRVHVVPKVGKAVLFSVEVHGGAGPAREEELVVRDSEDQWTPAFRAVREAMGLPSPRFVVERPR